MEIAPGKLVGKGRFEVLSRIGAGGAGLVYEVRDRESDAHLALKTVRSIYRPDTLVLLKREFRAVQDLAHPNLVRLDELFEENGVWFFTMELVDGTDWLTYVRPHDASAEGPYESRIRSTLPQIVEALSALHATGTVHRDVKPSNVLVSPQGSVKLLDFGLAAQPDRIVDPTADGLVGTPNYMAPELLRMREPLPAGDFYAVGVMLYQALTGKFPFFEQAPDVIRARLSGEPTRVRDVAPAVASDLAELCDALLRRNPQGRPSGAAVLSMIGARGRSSSEVPAAAEDFVGRSRELAVLEDAFAATREGAPVTVVIEGASGVGKSALVHHFLAGLRGPPLVLDGRCHEREYVPYKGLDAIMDQLASHLADPSQPSPADLDPATVRLLPRLFPVLRNVRSFAETSYGTRTSTEVGSRELRSRTYRAFRDLMAAIAAIRPLVLAIDDVQWADDDTLELLGDMLAPPSAPPVLLVCTRRIADEGSKEEPARGRAVFPGDVRRVTLGGLAPDE